MLCRAGQSSLATITCFYSVEFLGESVPRFFSAYLKHGWYLNTRREVQLFIFNDLDQPPNNPPPFLCICKAYPQEDLTDIFAWSTFANGLMAIMAGIVANNLVDFFGLTAPFIVAAIILAITFFLISSLWGENYGTREGARMASFVEGFAVVWRGKCLLMSENSRIEVDTILLTLYVHIK